MRCLIIGVDGSFGGALFRSLRSLGHEVVATTRRRDRAGEHLLLDLPRHCRRCRKWMSPSSVPPWRGSMTADDIPSSRIG